MNKLGAVCLALIMILTSQAVWAQLENKTITFAVDPNYPPMENVDSSGRIVGYSIDFFTAVCRESGLEAVFKKTDWDNIFVGLERGEYDAVMSSVTITPERRRTMDFTIPYYVVRQSLVVPVNSPLDNIRQLKDQRVGTQADTTATDIVAGIPGAISQTYEGPGEAIAALAKGELDAVICEDMVGAAFVSDPAYAGKLKTASIINTPGAEEIYAVAVRKNNLDVLIALNEGIKAVKAKGIEAELRRQWFK